MTHSDSGQTDSITSLLHHLSESLSKQSDQMLMERLGLGFSQFKITRAIRDSPNVTQRHIASQLGQTEASISRQIANMRLSGLVSVVVSPKSKREHHIQLTHKGIRIHEEAVRILQESHREMYAAIGEKSQKQLLQMFEVMHEQLCLPGKIGSCK